MRADVAAAIERAWPSSVVGMSFDVEESWFRDVHPKLARAFRRLGGARLLYEREAEEGRVWGDPDDDDSIPDESELRSYHLFFVSPADEAFEFESEIETAIDSGFDECGSDEELDGDSQMVMAQGRGYTGWSVAVSLVGPLAAIALSEYSVFEETSDLEPAIEHCIQGDDGRLVHPEDHFRKVHGEKLFQKLEKLRTRIAGILEKYGVTALPETEWRKEVSWLRGDGEALVGDVVNQPIRVFDAFFFQGAP